MDLYKHSNRSESDVTSQVTVRQRAAFKALSLDTSSLAPKMEQEGRRSSVMSKDLAGLDAETVKDGLRVALTYELRKYRLSDSGYKIMRKIHEIGWIS
jgi:hypothetical protein